MVYPVVNLGSRVLGQAPLAFAPSGPVDCSNVANYQKAVDNAASRIAYFQKAMQDAVAAGDQGAIDAASAGSDLANSDWNKYTAAVQGCGAPTSSPVAGINKTLVVGGALVAAVAVLGFVFGPKVRLS